MGEGYGDEAELLAQSEGLVRWVVRSVAFDGTDLDDLHQAARLALVLAARRWVPGRAKLATFAIPYMRNAARETARANERLRIPQHRRRVAARAAACATDDELSTGRVPSTAALARRSGLSERSIEAANRAVALGRVGSIDGLATGDGRELDQGFADPGAGPADLVAASEAGRILGSAVDRILGPRERAIVIARFGLDGGGPRTLGSLGQELGVSRQRVHQILHRALRLLAGDPTVGDLR